MGEREYGGWSVSYWEGAIGAAKREAAELLTMAARLNERAEAFTSRVEQLEDLVVALRKMEPASGQGGEA